MITSIEIVEQREDEESEDEDDEQIKLPEGLDKEEKKPWPDIFVLTSGMDSDILLHRLSNGVKIGQFAQEEPWNVYDMGPYEGRRPNLVREWVKDKKKQMLSKVEKAYESCFG